MTPPSPKAELSAALLTAVVGAPLALLFVVAAMDGQARAREAPLRALFGEETYAALAAGERRDLHYLGSDRLAPDFTLPDKDGRPWTLSSKRGKVLLLNFWSITCRPCVEEMPSLLELGRLVKGRDDVEIVAISVDEGWEKVASLFPPDVPITVLFDPEKKVVKERFGTKLYPETWVVDARGVIRLRYDGSYEWSSALVVNLLEGLR